MNAKRKDKWIPYLFILPFLISYVLFFLFPASYSFVLSFFRYRGYGNALFVGFGNYLNLIKYPTMWSTLFNTFFYFLMHFAPVMVLSFMLAVVVRSKGIRKYQNFYKPIIFMPQVCASVAAALVFKIIFGQKVGVINQFLGTEIPFLTDMNFMKWPVVMLLIWRSIGWYFVIFLSGLTTIGEEIEDASAIDGVNSIQSLIYIIIPLMKPIFMFAFITNAIGALKLYTEPNLLLGQGASQGPIQAMPYSNLIITNIQSGNFGMAAAAGWILVVVILVITLGQLKLFKGGEAN